MTKSYTEEAQRLANSYARQFHGPSYSLNDDDADFSLDEAKRLIAAAQKEKEDFLRSKRNQQHNDQLLAQQRESVGILKDSEADRFLRELNKSEQDWIDDAKAQATRYSQSRNAGTTPKSFDADDAQQRDIRSGVISWIERQRARGHFPKKK